MYFILKRKSMKKVLSLFALCAMFAFAGCNKDKKSEKHKPVKKEQVKKQPAKKSKKAKCNKSDAKCKTTDKKVKHHADRAYKHKSVK